MNGEIYPLLPWLHSSETCEHVFGECRKLIKDFTFLDFLYMIPRLHILTRAVVKLNHTSDPKVCASGYAHTYFDMEDINLATLSIFPPDEDIETAAKEAWEEADGLFNALGVSPTDFMGANTTPPNSAPHHTDLVGDLSEDEDECTEVEIETDTSKLQSLMDHEELEFS